MALGFGEAGAEVIGQNMKAASETWQDVSEEDLMLRDTVLPFEGRLLQRFRSFLGVFFLQFLLTYQGDRS